jgi:Ner family transcriptional regulator
MSSPSDSREIPEDPVQRNEWIKFQLRVRGSSLSKLARRLGVTRQAVRNALAASYPRMERVIALEIGLDPEHIWPERYRNRQRSDGIQARETATVASSDWDSYANGPSEEPEA